MLSKMISFVKIMRPNKTAVVDSHVNDLIRQPSARARPLVLGYDDSGLWDLRVERIHDE